MAFVPCWAKHAPEELQQPVSSKPMPASIRQNLSRTGPMKNRFRVLLGEACSQRAVATCLIKADAGQYSQKLTEQRAHEKSSSDPVGRSMPPKSCSNLPDQNRCRPVFAKTGREKTIKKKLSGPIGPKPGPRQPRPPGIKDPKRVLLGTPFFRRSRP
jgi:hypothetical protein